MPTITVDEDVWKELQQRAEPFIDTPNTVLRRLLSLDKLDNHVKDKVIEIQLSTIHGPRTYSLFPIPKPKRRFFPGYKIYFDLETDIGTVKTRMTSAPKGTPEGDPYGGAFIQGNLKPWYEKHPELKAGDKLKFEVLEVGKRYRLSII